MARRTWLIPVILALGSGPVTAQFPGQNIPPTRVPETAEPPLADKTKAADVPDKLKPSVIGAVPGRVTPAVPSPTPPDPPTPSVSIHVSAPASASAGADLEYKIVVENRSPAPAHHVKVTFPKQDDVQILRFEPEIVGGAETTKMLLWHLGTLAPGESRTIRVVVRPTKDGLEALDATARVQFEHGQRVRTALKRPQLAVRKITNQHALENQEIACKLVVENTGAVEVINVKLTDLLGDGLQLVQNGQPAGPLFQQKIPLLRPKEQREFTYTIRGTKSGSLTSKVEAEGERGAKATSDWSITVGPSPLTVKMTGPKQVYLNQSAKYDIEVNYTGAAPLENVVAVFSLPKGMKVVRATPGSQGFADRLQWPIRQLAPRQTLRFSVWAQMSTAGTVPNFVQLLWRGPPQRAEVITEFIGAAALHLDLRGDHNPVRAGQKVRYTLTVTNSGTKAADVKLRVTFPVTQFALDVDGSDGRALEQGLQEIDLKSVPPKGKVTRTVTLKATAPGQAVVHVEMESSELTAGAVTREEPTTITR